MKLDYIKKSDVLYVAVIVNEEKEIKGSPIHMTLNFKNSNHEIILPEDDMLGMKLSLKAIAEGDYFNENNVLENHAIEIDKEQFFHDYPQLKFLVRRKILCITTELYGEGTAKNSSNCDFEDLDKPYGIKGTLAVLDKEGNYAYRIASGPTDNLKESYLTEVRRAQLLSTSRAGDKYKNQNVGRWEEKSKCKVANTVADYNKIDMNNFWKNDILKFGVKIQGETDNYIVTVEFNNVLIKLKRYVQQAKNKFDRESVTRALMDAIDSSDVKIDCNCPDFKYRLAYYASQKGYKSGEQETRPADITNPNDSKGALCKHILVALNNASWIRNVASVIVNYANYCKENLEYNYSRFIFPKIFGVDYNKAVQMCIDDYVNGDVDDNLKSDEATINLSNFIAKKRFQNVRKKQNTE